MSSLAEMAVQTSFILALIFLLFPALLENSVSLCPLQISVQTAGALACCLRKMSSAVVGEQPHDLKFSFALKSTGLSPALVRQQLCSSWEM